MNKTDILALDAKLLMTFKQVYDSGSVTLAAKQMKVSQSTVSHALDRLREILGDPLFVRVGRSIAPTERAIAIAPEIDEVLKKLTQLLDQRQFDAASATSRFVLSANEYEREALSYRLVPLLLREAPKARLSLVDSRETPFEDLRRRECDVVITPIRPYNTYDLYSQPLFDDGYLCAFDPHRLSAERVTEDYLALKHIVFRYAKLEPSLIDDALLQSTGQRRNIVIEAPSMGALVNMIKGTELVATLPSRAAAALFSGMGTCECPFDVPTLSFHMVWHKTTHHSAQHRWFRQLINRCIESESQ